MTKAKVLVYPYYIFFAIVLLVLFVSFLIDSHHSNFSGDGLYWTFWPSHILFAEFIALPLTVVIVFLARFEYIKRWLVSLLFTLFFIFLSIYNFHSGYRVEPTESNFRQDVMYTCQLGEMMSTYEDMNTDNHKNICAVRLAAHQDSDFLKRLGIGSFPRGNFSYMELLTLLIAQLFIFTGPLYFFLRRSQTDGPK